MQMLNIFILLFVLGVCAARPSEFEKGGGKEYEGQEYSSHGEKGDKGYAAEHAQESGAKGHHDEEGHSGHYAENGGKKSSHNHEDGYHGSHEAGEKGSKGSEFAEEGSYSKGHSTKGKHTIHKLKESKKRTDFYDEDHDEAYQEKEGGSESSYGSAKGENEKGGHYKKVELEGEFGNGGSFKEGKFFKESAGHKNAGGQDKHFAHGEEFSKNGGNEGFKKWQHGDEHGEDAGHAGHIY